MTSHNALNHHRERDDYLRNSYRREADELIDDVIEVALALPPEDTAELFDRFIEAFQTVAAKSPAVESQLRAQNPALWAFDQPTDEPQRSLEADVAGALAAIGNGDDTQHESADDSPAELVDAVTGPRRRRGRKT